LKGQNREINNYANWSIGLQSTFNPTGVPRNQHPSQKLHAWGLARAAESYNRAVRPILAAIINDAHALSRN
jgi:hypothetical protein